MIQIYDTASSDMVELTNPDKGTFSMYVCGPTVYDLPHLGHGRMVVIFDLLRRHLANSGLLVTHVSNITDIDDKIIDRAVHEGSSPTEIAQRYEAEWWCAMDRLGVMRPTYSPRATEWIPQMIALIVELVERGAAYVSDGGVYLEVSKVPRYGELTHQDLARLRAGARVEVDESKRSVIDFALWKRVDEDGAGFPSPFGYGRPGWHTECVVMSRGLLGDDFDLHGGGLDLVFPHHENEWAQAKVLGVDFAHHWMHNGFVEMGGVKMSKSIGNTLNLVDLLDAVGGRTLRFAYLRGHYRSPIDMTLEGIKEAGRALERVDGFLRRVGSDLSGGVLGTELERARRDEFASFLSALDMDLDTPSAFAVLFDVVRAGNAAVDHGEDAEAIRLGNAAKEMLAWLGLLPPERDAIPDWVIARAEVRETAKAAGDYDAADAIRVELAGLGYAIKDTKSGPEIQVTR
ncbi:MAG: cysteine--tRNA ligase [Ferrimicrobium sp.]